MHGEGQQGEVCGISTPYISLHPNHPNRICHTSNIEIFLLSSFLRKEAQITHHQ